ncbi:MAG: outer membrane beta-barrel protein [Pseudomonadota bacterium]|nr:outer membrane beta-barrel protein [Pseudomonadota bacterium]
MLKQLSAIAIALLATQAHAAANQPFVDIGLGQASLKEFCDEVIFGGTISCDDKDTFFRVGAGVMLNQTFSAEVSYLNFGEATYEERAGIRSATASVESQAVALQIGTYAPIAQSLNVYGKLGIAYADFDVNAVARGPNGVVNLSSSDSELEAIVTAGASYNFMPNIGVNVQLDYLPNVGTEDSGEDDITAFSLGLKYQF